MAITALEQVEAVELLIMELLKNMINKYLIVMGLEHLILLQVNIHICECIYFINLMIFYNYKSSCSTNRVQQMLKEPQQQLNLCKSFSLTPYYHGLVCCSFVLVFFTEELFLKTFFYESIKVGLDRTQKISRGAAQ